MKKTLIAVLLIFISRSVAVSVVLPEGFVETEVVSGLIQPTSMTFAPDGRLFFSEARGNVRVIKNGNLLSHPFVSVNTENLGERGLVGIAFDPNFADNQFVYIYYTVPNPGNHLKSFNRISRFRANGDVAAPGETALMDLPEMGNAMIHHGGSLHFGPDGKLYASPGDHEFPDQARSLSSTFGKIIRINKDGSIPVDNPFYSITSGQNRAIYAKGLRSCFTFAIHPFTGRMMVNDVGNTLWEEVNEVTPGADFGWPNSEGDTNEPGVTRPSYSYFHDANGGCAVTGGVFYTPSVRNFPDQYLNDYFFQDYCYGYIRVMDYQSGFVSEFTRGYRHNVDLDVGPDGALYYLSRGEGFNTGSIGRIEYALSTPPEILQNPSDKEVFRTEQATFTVAASGREPLSFQWQRNGSDIPGANSQTFTTPGASDGDNGSTYRCVVSNAHGTAISQEATLHVIPNTPPNGRIIKPKDLTTYRGGQWIQFSATGSDPEQGALPNSAFKWRVVFHHEDHTHPILENLRGRSGSFVIPSFGETSPNVWYRLQLIITDSKGASFTTYRDIQPILTEITLDTKPSGREIFVEGQPKQTPYTFTSVAGLKLSVEAPTPMEDERAVWKFQAWSHGKPAKHLLTLPSKPKTYVASYLSSGTGEGLTGFYYNNPDFTEEVHSRLDRRVNFSWNTGSPDSAVDGNSFSVRWEGQVQPQFSEEYTFHLFADEGVRLFVNNLMLFDQLANRQPREFKGSILLEAGEKYNIVVEYVENKGPSFIKLLWSSPSTPKQVIPQSQLYP